MLHNVLRRRLVRRAVLSVSLVALVAAVPAVAQDADAPTETQDGRVKGYVPPPTNLKLVGDHWTPYDPPAPPEGAQVHVIEKGDTLWDLAGRFYDDNYLWPVIWDANRYVTYSHWIYPGDPLVIPPRPTVVGDSGVEPPIPPVVPVEDEPEQPEQVVEKQPEGPVLFPAMAGSELFCSARLVEQFDPTQLTIQGRDEPEKELQATGDIVYLSAGQNTDIQPGAEYSVVREVADVMHPEDGRFQAKYVSSLGKLRVIAVHADSATAEIVESCEAMVVGDHLVPYQEMPVPMIERVALETLATPYPGRLNGWVVIAGEPQETIAGAGDVVGIDLGSAAGLTAGDRVLFWRNAEGTTARKVTAHGVVLTTSSAGATVKVLESNQEVVIGDRAEVL